MKQGVTMHTIETNKFKTNLFALFLATPLTKKTATCNALLAAVLRRGSKNLPTQQEITKKLEALYGAVFNCGIDKNGDNQVLKFYVEALNEAYLPKAEPLTKASIQTLLEIVFEPYIENGTFKKEYVEAEKENLKNIIRSKVDNKAKYALDRCIEEMYQDEPYGVYKFGYIEDIDTINEKTLYAHYQNLIQTCKIDILISGNDVEAQKDRIEHLPEIQNISARTPDYIPTTQNNNTHLDKQETVVTESMQVKQGKLTIGLDVDIKAPQETYAVSVYNTILGSGANSKLFRNVREKASLAYTAGSNYMKTKSAIFIRAGIEIANYEKAVHIIKEQLEEMKQGKFTDEDLKDAKQLITSTIKSIPEEQDTQITYYYGKELSGNMETLEAYAENIQKVQREEVQKVAQNIKINTIYFLKDETEGRE